MKLLFCYSNKIGSRLIRWALREPVSHVAFEFSSGLIVHSTFSGVGLAWDTEFHKEHTIPLYLDATVDSVESEIDLMNMMLDIYMGRKYDYTAFIYFSWRALLFHLFRVPLPARNKWNDKGRYLCTELAALFLGREPDPMISPYQLYNKLVKEPGRA